MKCCRECIPCFIEQAVEAGDIIFIYNRKKVRVKQVVGQGVFIKKRT